MVCPKKKLCYSETVRREMIINHQIWVVPYFETNPYMCVYIYKGNHPQFMALNLEIYEMNDPDSQNMFKKSCNPNSPNL